MIDDEAAAVRNAKDATITSTTSPCGLRVLCVLDSCITEDDTRAPRPRIGGSISRIHSFECTLTAILRLTPQFTVRYTVSPNETTAKTARPHALHGGRRRQGPGAPERGLRPGRIRNGAGR